MSKENSADTQEAKPKDFAAEYKQFIEGHELQGYGMSFPMELGEKLYFKLKNEIFDTHNFFEILDNEDESRFMLKAKKNLEKNSHVFLIDHCWTFKLRQFNDFCAKYPSIIKRATSMLKYSTIKKDIMNMSYTNLVQKEEKDIVKYNSELAAKNNYVNGNYDDYNITSDIFEVNVIKNITSNTETISLDGNKIDNIFLIYDMLTHNPNIKGIWLNDNPFIDVEPEYEEYLIANYPQIEILNRKLTKHSGTWCMKYGMKNDVEDWAFKYNKVYANEVLLDGSGRDPFNLPSFSVFESNIVLLKGVSTLDISDNDYGFDDNDNKTNSEKLISLLKALPRSGERIIIDDNDDIFQDYEENKEIEIAPSLFTNRSLLQIIQKDFPNIKYINNMLISNILLRNESVSSLIQFKREAFVYTNMWSIIRTYRLITSEKYDEEPIWYINDEFGSSINHSDSPNAMLFPLIFSKSGTFKQDEGITYSILWTSKDIKAGEEVFIDYGTNIDENMERSARLTTWYNTPKEYFKNKFVEKIKKFNIKDEDITEYKKDLKKGIDNDKEGKENRNEDGEKIFDFTLCNKNHKLKEEALNKIHSAIKEYNKSKGLVNAFKEGEVIKVFTDYDYVKQNGKLPNMELTTSFNDANIIWIKSAIFDSIQSGEIKGPNENVLINQFPYEAIIVKKDFLTEGIQNYCGGNQIINITYDGKTELAELIGNYNYNSVNNYDNTWIGKPTNMARSMDITVTNNGNQIIRSLETGPKICQKYLNRPLLMNQKKFDLRFIILVKRLLPGELYFYSKMFWVRSANKNYTLDEASFNDYQVHFTVMNYGEFNLQTIYNTDLIAYLKENGIEWDPIYTKIKQQIEFVFTVAGRNCPQMINENSKGIYGLDAMIDENLEPKIIELNFQPDCKRACQHIPEFYNDIFNTLFLNKPSGVELVSKDYY